MIISHFLLGFAVSFVGSLPLGVLNLSVIDITLKKNIKEAAYFSAAAAFIEFFQAFIALKFSSYIASNPVIEQIINIGVIPVFVGLGVYYLRQDSSVKENTKKEISNFSKGLILATLNPLSIPFWLIWGTYFQLKGWLGDDNVLILTFVIGIVLGTFVVLMGFGYFAMKIISKIQVLNKYINVIIGVTLLVLGLLQLLIVLDVISMTPNLE